MKPTHRDHAVALTSSRLGPAQPLWRLAPTHDDDGRCLADFMMLIPELSGRPEAVREQVASRVREVCEAYAGQVAFADINYSINVLWISVVAEPGLAGRVAQSIRGRVPEALLVGGQLGAVPTPLTAAERRGLWGCIRHLSRRVTRYLAAPPAD